MKRNIVNRTNMINQMGKRFLVSILAAMSVCAGAGLVNAACNYTALFEQSNITVSAESDVVYAATVTEDEAKETLKYALMSAWDNHDKSLSMSSIGLKGVVTIEMYDEVYNELLAYNYQYFYLSAESEYSYYTASDNTDYVTKVEFEYLMSKNEAKAALAELDAAVETALSGVDSSWSDLEKVIYFHDYLTRICEYDTTYSNYSVYNALIDNSAVCQGYSTAFYYLLSCEGISCEFVSSKELNHVWNVVEINGKYYMVDVTYDDPTNPDRLGRSNHKYFLKSAASFMSDGKHEADDWVFSGGLTVSDVASEYYDDYFWNDVTTGFEYVNGKWYGLNGTSISIYACNGKDMTFKSSVITISTKWKVWGTTSSYWSGCYTSLASYNSALYYSTADAIYMYVPSTGKTSTVYELDDKNAAKGYLYGMRVLSDGTVEFYLATSPNNDSTADVYTALGLSNVDTRVDMAECTINLSATSYTYTGTEKKPSVVVKYNGKVLTSGTDYNVTYSNNINAGAATVSITGRGNYIGTVDKSFLIIKASQKVSASVSDSTIVKGSAVTVTASGIGTITYSSSSKSVATVSSSGTVTGKGYGTVKITVKASGNANYEAASTTLSIKVKLKTPSITSISNTSEGVKVKWGSVSGASMYRVYRKTSSGSWKKLADTTSTSYTDKTAKNGTKYYYTVRCITKSGTATSSYSTSGKSYYRLSTPTLSSLKCTVAKTLTVKYSKNTKATGYQVQYSTSKSFNTVAKTYNITKNTTLSKKITGLKKGKTYYVRVRSYKKSGSTKYYSGWTAASVKVTK